LSAKPRIALVATGGTIDSVGVDRLDLAWYWENQQRLGPGQLLARVPELANIATVEEAPFRRFSSGAMTPADWLDMSRLLDELLSDCDGAVVTHGTNTLEETAYFLHLTLCSDKPVVVTGAMRPSSGLSSDGDLNLLNAIRVAANPSSRGKGALVLLNDTVHAARDATKTNTYRVNTFQSPDAGPLGYADSDGTLVWLRAPVRKHGGFAAASLSHLPRVDILLSYPGADGALIDAAVGAGAQGLVSAGAGAGRPTPLEDEALDRACRRGVVVVQASRTGSGRVARTPNLRSRSIVAAGDLRPWKARVLLMLALTVSRDAEQVQQIFDEY